MLRVGGKDAGPGLCSTLHEEIASADKAFLVRERNSRAAIHGRERRLQSGRAADCRHHPIRRSRGCFDNSAFARAAFGARAGQRIFQLREATGIGDSREARAEFFRQLRQPLHVAISGQRCNQIAVARGPQQIHRAVADRPRTTEDGHRTYRRCRSLVVTQWNWAHEIHQTIRPRPTPSTPPRKNPRNAASTTAATNPSRRSINPPCPGMIWLESLTPKRRFTADSKRSPRWEAMDRNAASSRKRAKFNVRARSALFEPNTTNPPATTRLPRNPPKAPAHVFFGLTP